MTIVLFSQLIGTVAIFLLFCIKFYIAVNFSLYHRVGRIAMLWASLYIFELFFLRLLSLMKIGTMDQLQIIAGFTALIPLGMVLMHLFFTRHTHTVDKL